MRNELYIDGRWVRPIRGASTEVTNPATEEVIQTIAAATEEDVDLAVKAARRAFDKDGWPKLSGAQRATYLRSIADGIRARQAEIARLEVLDNGKPFLEADWDVWMQQHVLISTRGLPSSSIVIRRRGSLSPMTGSRPRR